MDVPNEQVRTYLNSKDFRHGVCGQQREPFRGEHVHTFVAGHPRAGLPKYQNTGKQIAIHIFLIFALSFL